MIITEIGGTVGDIESLPFIESARQVRHDLGEAWRHPGTRLGLWTHFTTQFSGTVFVLENAGEVGEKEDPYWAVLSCPSCGTLGFITRKQMAGLLPVICGSTHCSAQFFIHEEEITPRKPF